eukprot:944796-Pleurochrysis_carterae.AAC.5
MESIICRSKHENRTARAEKCMLQAKLDQINQASGIAKTPAKEFIPAHPTATYTRAIRTAARMLRPIPNLIRVCSVLTTMLSPPSIAHTPFNVRFCCASGRIHPATRVRPAARALPALLCACSRLQMYQVRAWVCEVAPGHG